MFTPIRALREHWPEYLMEAWGLGAFMVSAGVFAGMLLWLFIAVEAPYSGMSINPARTLASGVLARIYDGLWIYLSATIGGMLVAGELYRRWPSAPPVYCAKLDHHGHGRCIFKCRFNELLRAAGMKPVEITHE